MLVKVINESHTVRVLMRLEDVLKRERVSGGICGRK